MSEKVVWELRIHRSEVRNVMAKYRKLVREIETNAPRGDMLHSAMKLGIFIGDMLGYKNGESVLDLAKDTPEEAAEREST